MQVIVDTSTLKASRKKDIPELEELFWRLELVYGPLEALERLFEYFRLRWRKRHLEAWASKYRVHRENLESEDWLVKTKSEDHQEQWFIAWMQRNFYLVCKQTEIPAHEILEEAGEKAFIPPNVFKELQH